MPEDVPHAFLKSTAGTVSGPLAMNAADELLGAVAVARHGARTALICGDDQLSYSDLARQVRRAAGAVAALGLRPGERVLLLMRDSPEMAAAWLGIVRAGGVAVALNTKLPEEDYRHIHADSGARITLIEDVFAAARPDLTREFAAQGRLAVAGACDVEGAVDWRATLAAARDDAPAFAARADDPAFWLYSSGTTGRPKGIIHTQANLLCAGMGQREVLALGPDDRVLATSKLFFSYSLEHGLLGPLSIGASAILHPDWADPDSICALVARHRPSAFFSVPSFYRRLLDAPAHARAALAEVRYFVSAGERLPASVNEAWQRATGREILIAAGPGGHFVTSGLINGKTVQFMVDTGATTVAMGRGEADRLGIDWKSGQRALSQTAGGVVASYGVQLTSVRIGDVEVFGVNATILPVEMPFVLLGNSFLGRFAMRRDASVMKLEKRD